MHFDATVKKKPVVMILMVTAVLIAIAAWTLLSYRANGTLPWANFIPTQPSKLITQDDDSDVLYAPRSAQNQLVIRPPVINQVNDEEEEETKTSNTTPTASPTTTLSNLPDDETPDILSKTQNISSQKITPDSETSLAEDSPIAMTIPNTNRLTTQPSSATPLNPPSLANKTPEKLNIAPTNTTRPTQLDALPPNKTRDKSFATSLSTTPRNKNIGNETRPSLREDMPESDPNNASSDSTQESARDSIQPNSYSELDESLQNLAPSAIAVIPQEKPARKKSGIVVIVNKSNSKTLSKAEISNIYRDRITRWPTGERILVLNLPLDTVVRQRFSSTVLNMSPLDAATEYSNGMITNRLQNDYRTRNARIVVSYVERHENAIGYVPAEALSETDNVRVAYTIP